jgi:hypothetical protein
MTEPDPGTPTHGQEQPLPAAHHLWLLLAVLILLLLLLVQLQHLSLSLSLSLLPMTMIFPRPTRCRLAAPHSAIYCRAPPI